MEKKKKIIIFILILFIIVVIGSISFAIIYHDNTTVEVLEISALIEKFEIESNTHQISLNENEENVKSDINETEESISNKKKSSSKKNSNSKKKHRFF